MMCHFYVADLLEVVQPLSLAYESSVRNLGVSVADFWAKCGQVASKAGRRNACKIHMLKYGNRPFNHAVQLSQF